MTVLDRAVKLPKLEPRKIRRRDRDSRSIGMSDLESLAMIADPYSANFGVLPWRVRSTLGSQTHQRITTCIRSGRY